MEEEKVIQTRKQKVLRCFLPLLSKFYSFTVCLLRVLQSESTINSLDSAALVTRRAATFVKRAEATVSNFKIYGTKLVQSLALISS